MNKLIIDPSGGLSGDMFCAALMSICPDRNKMIYAMTEAANHLGECIISYIITDDNAYKLNIDISSEHHSITEDEARNIMTDLYTKFNITDYYRELGINILNILIEAEKEAHAKYDFFKKGKIKEVQHLHTHKNSDQKAHLHEAQDIVIDIIGSVYGMQLMSISKPAWLVSQISVGGGQIDFSHGLLYAPAPATSIILKSYDLPWKNGPIDHELFTPTGAAILAGLEAKLDTDLSLKDCREKGFARGSKDYPIPPLKIGLC